MFSSSYVYIFLTSKRICFISWYCENPIQLKQYFNFILQTSESFVDVISNLLDTRNQAGWQEIHEINSSLGSELLLNNTERFTFLLATSLGENETEVSFSKENIGRLWSRSPNQVSIFLLYLATCLLLVIEVKDVPVMEGEQLQAIVFPESKNVDNFTSNTTNFSAVITLPPSLLMDRAKGCESVWAFTGIFLDVLCLSFVNLNECIKIDLHKQISQNLSTYLKY